MGPHTWSAQGPARRSAEGPLRKPPELPRCHLVRTARPSHGEAGDVGCLMAGKGQAGGSRAETPARATARCSQPGVPLGPSRCSDLTGGKTVPRGSTGLRAPPGKVQGFPWDGGGCRLLKAHRAPPWAALTQHSPHRLGQASSAGLSQLQGSMWDQPGLCCDGHTAHSLPRIVSPAPSQPWPQATAPP